MALRLLFVCTGNICRSPMAVGLADLISLQRNVDVELDSAGTLGLEGRPAAPKAVAVCHEIGVDLRRHVSKGVSQELVDWAEHVFVMEHVHADKLREAFGDAVLDKVVAMGPLAGKPGIEDPYGRWFKGPYRTARDDIRTALERWFAATAASP